MDLIKDFSWRFWKVVEKFGEENEYINVREATEEEIDDVLNAWTDWEHGSGFLYSDEDADNIFYMVCPEKEDGSLMEDCREIEKFLLEDEEEEEDEEEK